MGIGLSIGGFLATTTIANNWFFKKRTLALSIVIASGGIGGLIFVPVVMKVIEGVGWRATYLVTFAVVVIFSIILPGLIIRNNPEDLEQVPDGGSSAQASEMSSPARQLYATPMDFTFGEALRTRTYWLLILFSIPFGFSVPNW